jgi:hypothetical protein
MGYEAGMQAEILSLLRLFHDRAPDRETNTRVISLIADQGKWARAHDLFDEIRDLGLRATGDAGRPPVPKEQIDWVLVAQYVFEELCLKSVFNETDTKYPFDPCSPYWVAGAAIQFARGIGVPIEDVILVIAPERRR